MTPPDTHSRAPRAPSPPVVPHLGRLELDPRLVAQGNFRYAGGQQAMRRLLSGGGAPEAVFAFNDMTALGAMSVIRDAGLRIPDDIAVVGFDDIPIAALTAPGLTTMAMPKGELGRAAASTLSRLLAGGSAVSVTRQVFDVELVVRHSSVRRPNGNGNGH